MMSKGKKFFQYAFLTIVSLLSVFPLYYMFCGATNKSTDVVAGRLYPGGYLVENFKSLIANQDLARALFNSFRNFFRMFNSDHEIYLCGSYDHYSYERMEQLSVAEGNSENQ